MTHEEYQKYPTPEVTVRLLRAYGPYYLSGGQINLSAGLVTVAKVKGYDDSWKPVTYYIPYKEHYFTIKAQDVIEINK
jgi:hypothetical protein